MSNTGSLFGVWDYSYTQVGVTKYHFQIQNWYDQSNPTILELLEPPEPPQPPTTIWFQPELNWNYQKCQNPQF